MLAGFVASGHGCRVRLPRQAQGGHEVWLDLDMFPLRDARGALSGFPQIGTGVTAQRRNRLRLEGARRKNDALCCACSTCTQSSR